MRARRLLAAALLPLAIACDHGRIDVKPPSSVAPITEAPLPDKLRAEATAGVTDPALRELLARHWSWWLAEDPVWATKYGDHRFDDRIADGSAEHHEARVRQERAFLAEAKALHPTNEADRITLALLANQLDTDLAGPIKEPHAAWDTADLDAFPRGIEAAIEGEIRPAYARYRPRLPVTASRTPTGPSPVST